MSAEVFGLTQQILMLISAYINTGVCGKLRLWETTQFWQNCDNDTSTTELEYSFLRYRHGNLMDNFCTV